MSDAVGLGGGSLLVLAFPAPGSEGAIVERATLVLHVHEADPSNVEALRIEVRRAKEREIDASPRPRALRRSRREAASRRIDPRPGARIDLDVTELVRAAGVDRPFALVVRGRADETVTFASPRAANVERRPYVDVLLR
jgi:hypothetical protein